VGSERFGAIIDTGAPFWWCPAIAIDANIADQSWPSGLASTVERFDNNQGEVEGRMTPFGFVNATGSLMGPSAMVFGVLSDPLMSGPGGIFMGLIRGKVDSTIFFLRQTNVKALEIDLRDSTQPKTLTLSNRPSILSNNDEDYIPLVRFLNRKYDPVVHYTARASTFQVNGMSVLAQNDRQPFYVIFDTGVAGMVVSQELMDQR